MNNNSLSENTFLTVLFIRIWLAIVRTGFVILVCAMWVGTFCTIFGGNDRLSFSQRHVQASIVDLPIPLGLFH
ncbi:MAG: hypothetical protein FIA96_00505 [Betaproteobacteria bacterium]|nr:hypothetical protein [Betaproteobacteria bacterium]